MLLLFACVVAGAAAFMTLAREVGELALSSAALQHRP
jgi:hypothetical protein